MSVSSDLAAAFAEISLTVPVRFARTGAVTRGFLDRGVAIATGAGMEMEHASDVLHVVKGALAGAHSDDELTIGAVGATDVADDDPTFVVRGDAALHDDGAFDHLIVAEVDA